VRVAVAVLLGVMAARTNLGAQVGYLWSFGELGAKADLVVIAEHVRTVDTTRRTDHPELRPALPVAELESAFNVLTVLKVDAAIKSAGAPQLRLKHYRIDSEEWRRRNPPQPGLPPGGLVNAGSMLDFSNENGPYLMFLKRGEAGMYEPLSGHTVPTDSVYLLQKQRKLPG
jgi:hypothetical protein